MVFELPQQIRWNSYFEVPNYTSWFPPHKAGNCSQKYYIIVAIKNGTTYIVLFHNHPALKPRKCSKSPPFSNTTKFHPAFLEVAGHVTSNSGKRSDVFHSTRENSENLNRWFLLNGKGPISYLISYLSNDSLDYFAKKKNNINILQRRKKAT